MTQQEFFNSLASGATWSAGVAFKRSNPLPLDRYSVFASYSDAQAYLSEAICYPGQVLAVVENITETVGEERVITGVKTTVYVVEVDTEGAYGLKEVGTKPVGDEASIEDHMGFIKFGSRVDIYLPLDAEILVKIGDKTTGGITEVARLKS